MLLRRLFCGASVGAFSKIQIPQNQWLERDKRPENFYKFFYRIFMA
jgi:hypothetical protein